MEKIPQPHSKGKSLKISVEMLANEFEKIMEKLKSKKDWVNRFALVK